MAFVKYKLPPKTHQTETTTTTSEQVSKVERIAAPVIRNNTKGSTRKERRDNILEAARKRLSEVLESDKATGQTKVAVVFGDADKEVNKRRAEKALEMYRNSRTNFFVLCGTDREISGLATALRTGKVPDERILRVGESIDNVDNVRQTIGVMKGQLKEFSVITSAFQERRTRLTFNRQMMSANSHFNITYDSATHPEIMKGRWARLGGEALELGFSATLRFIPDLGIYEWFKNTFELTAKAGKRIEDSSYRSGKRITNFAKKK